LASDGPRWDPAFKTIINNLTLVANHPDK
jgi:hypothetical protein